MKKLFSLFLFGVFSFFSFSQTSFALLSEADYYRAQMDIAEKHLYQIIDSVPDEEFTKTDRNAAKNLLTMLLRGQSIYAEKNKSALNHLFHRVVDLATDSGEISVDEARDIKIIWGEFWSPANTDVREDFFRAFFEAIKIALEVAEEELFHSGALLYDVPELDDFSDIFSAVMSMYREYIDLIVAQIFEINLQETPSDYDPVFAFIGAIDTFGKRSRVLSHEKDFMASIELAKKSYEKGDFKKFIDSGIPSLLELGIPSFPDKNFQAPAPIQKKTPPSYRQKSLDAKLDSRMRYHQYLRQRERSFYR